jgi:TRAP-type uncharacterized transport system substrate-binding protein
MKTRLLLALLLVFASGCDILTPNKTFRLAISRQSEYYHYIANHLAPMLSSRGYRLQIVEADNAFAASEIVSRGDADLTLLNNFSYPVAESLNERASQLRTILPIATRVFFVYSRKPLPANITADQLFTNATVGVETLNGETHKNLERRFERAAVQGVKFVPESDNTSDLIAFWSTLYSDKAQKLQEAGWHVVSLDENWIDFNTRFDNAVSPFVLPALPGDPTSTDVNTYSSEVILIGNHQLGENSIYELCSLVFQHRLELINKDRMYLAITEDFSPSSMLFPIHEGTRAYLNRDQPTLLERYADTIALFFSFGALIYGVAQTLHNRMRRKQKDRLDVYFLEFLRIRSDKESGMVVQIQQLNDLHRKALEQMTKEQLEKGDFHILSRLIQQELALVKGG